MSETEEKTIKQKELTESAPGLKLGLKLGLIGFVLGLFWHFIGFDWV